MKLEGIKREFVNHGWRYSQDWDDDGEVHEFTKYKYGFLCVSNHEKLGFVFSGGVSDFSRTSGYRADDESYYQIGDIYSIDFEPEKHVNVRLYDGTFLHYCFDEDGYFYGLEENKNYYSLIEKPDYELDADDRPHRFVVEVALEYKTFVSVFAHNKEEAISLVSVDSLGEEKYQKGIIDNLECVDPDNPKVIKEYWNERFPEVVVDEFNVRI